MGGDLRGSTVADLVRRSARRHPARVAVEFEDRSWTYAEFDDAITRVAARLLSLGLAHGERVAAFARNSDAYALLYLACARAGLVHVPINYNATGADLVYHVQQSSSAALFVAPPLASVADGVASELSAVRHRGSIDDLVTWGREDGPLPVVGVAVADTDLVQLLYTSGTTSRPKGAMMTHRAFIHEYLSCITALDLSASDRPVHALPLYHSAQMHVYLLPYLALGATNRIVEAPDPSDLLRRVAEDGVDSLFLPPTVWIAIANHPDLARLDLTGLRKAYYGASIMPVPVLQRLRKALPAAGFYNCFGQSEVGPLTTVLRPEEHDARPDSAGRPVMFVETRVVDADGVDVAPGELGEVVYRSPQLCEGYWDKPEETAEAFAGGWFHSGDLVRQDEEGYIFVVDRTKDVINTGGVLVASREVEEALYEHPAVAEVAVIATPHEKWVEAITAVVVLGDGASADDAELIAFSRERLAAHKVPKAVFFADELPKNPSGKLLKRELRDRYSRSNA
ncbi:MAG: acyl-CoA synthetase [Solirubrobacteraceae bacterium]|nr:acyl-CoA synthetase [Solirubrobacteraceae bacterium]